MPARCVEGQGAHPLHELMPDVWDNALPIPSTGSCLMCEKMQCPSRHRHLEATVSAQRQEPLHQGETSNCWYWYTTSEQRRQRSPGLRVQMACRLYSADPAGLVRAQNDLANVLEGVGRAHVPCYAGSESAHLSVDVCEVGQ